MGTLTPQKHYHMHEIAACWNGNPWLWRENAQILQFTGRGGDMGKNTHTCCSVSTALPDRISHQSFVCVWAQTFFSFSHSLSLHHMCEFYRNGWGFQRTLDLSNKPQQAVKPSFSASHRDGDSQWRSESGDWNLITALKPSESNMRERDET